MSSIDVCAQICGSTKSDISHLNITKNSDSEYIIKLVVWLVGNDEGEGFLSADKVNNMFSKSFPIFEEHGIYFEVCSSKYINDTDFLDNPDKLVFGHSNQEYFLEGFVNYYLIDEQSSAFQGGIAGRKGSDLRAWGYYSEDLTSFIFCHEIGHALGLFHTFSGDDCFSDCESDGDFICDTPPDPYKVQTDQSPSVVGYSYRAPCDFVNVSNIRTQCGELFTDLGYEVPYGQNMMSYYLGYDCPDLKRFTPGQGEYMRNYIANFSDIILVEDDPFLFAECGSRRNFVWNDTNGNGVQDQFENGIPNVKIELINSHNFNHVVQSTFSDDKGFYDFENIEEGNYFVQFEIPNNKISTFKKSGIEDLDSDISEAGRSDDFIVLGKESINIDAGFLTPSKIGNKVWIDMEGGLENLFDANDIPFEGVRIYLYDASTSTTIAETVSDENGNYFFEVLPGIYSLKFNPGPDFSPVSMNAGSEALDSDINPVSYSTHTFEIGTSKTNLNVDAGFIFSEVLAISSYDFNARYDPFNQEVNTSWGNNNSKDIETFILERSYNSLDRFEEIYSTKPGDDTTVYFEFIDQGVSLSGDYYYRLTERNHSGIVEYSEIKTVHVNRTNFPFVYPNPSTSIFQFVCEICDDAHAEIKVIDKLGRTIVNKQQLNSNFQIDMTHVPDGVYFAKIRIGQKTDLIRLIKSD